MGTTTKKKKKQDLSAGDALAVIVEEGGTGALKIVGDVMASNSESSIKAYESMYEAEKAENAELRRQLRQSQYKINVIRDRIDWLLGGDLDGDTMDEIIDEVETERNRVR